MSDTATAKGQLPKAYLRVDPDIDHKHPDNLDGFVRLLCAANRQIPRGRFRDRTVLDSLFGKSMVHRYFQRGDLHVTEEGPIEVVGWDHWQEGDLSVSARMRAYRGRKAVTPTVTVGVTPAVTLPSPSRIPTSIDSKAARLQGSKASDSLAGERPAPDPEPLMDAIRYIEERSRRPFGFGLGSKPWDTLQADVRDFGWPKVKAEMEAVKEPFPDVAQLVFGASRRLHPIESPKNGVEPPDPDYVKSALEERRKARSAHA